MALNLSNLLRELAARAEVIASGGPTPSTGQLESILAGADIGDALILEALAAAAAAWGDPVAAELLSALAVAVSKQKKPHPTYIWVWKPGSRIPSPQGGRTAGSWSLVEA